MCEVVAVAFGGQSNEHEVSVITGLMTLNILKKSRAAIALYITRGGEFLVGEKLENLNTFKQNDFKKCKKAALFNGGILAGGKNKFKFIPIKCLLNCCHGGWGEGGGLSGACQAANIPVAGAGVFESSAFMDKYLTKIVLAGLKVKTVDYIYVRRGETLPQMPGFPIIVKPSTLGSSIGVQVAHNEEELNEGLECAFLYDSSAILERYFSDRREINCAACRIGGKVITSECEEAVTAGDILSYEDKYEGGGRSVFPAQISAENSTRIRKTTEYVYEKLNMNGIVRFDYILADDIYLSEVNTVPGSLAYYLFGGFEKFPEVLSGLIDQAISTHKSGKNKLICTGILSNLPSNACKRGAK